MKYFKIIITIIVILFLIICIRIYNVSSTYNYLFINANEQNINNIKIEGIK